jgi:hypothetical protein
VNALRNIGSFLFEVKLRVFISLHLIVYMMINTLFKILNDVKIYTLLDLLI